MKLPGEDGYSMEPDTTPPYGIASGTAAPAGRRIMWAAFRKTEPHAPPPILVESEEDVWSWLFNRFGCGVSAHWTARRFVVEAVPE